MGLAGVETGSQREGELYGEPRFCNARATQLPRVCPGIKRALEGEYQLRRAGGFSSHASLLLLCNSLAQVLRVILLAVFMGDGVFVAGW